MGKLLYDGEMNRGTASRKRVAFFGGSFDPPHFGHLAIARAARDVLRLDEILFAPVGAQPLKPAGSTAPFADRLEMTKLAIDREPAFEISLIDAPDPEGKPNYTIDTLHTLRTQLGADTELFCLMGADSFLNLHHWHGGAEIPFAASLIVASRPGQQLGDFAGMLGEGFTLEPVGDTALAQPKPEAASVRVEAIRLETFRLSQKDGRTGSFYLLPDLDVEISASAIREQLKAEPAQGAGRLVPRAVCQYIREHQLYAERTLPPSPASD